MRRLLRLLPLGALLLAGCAGNVADYIGRREGIVASELSRFGLDPRQTECVAYRLTATLSPRQLRYLNRALRAVGPGQHGTDGPTVRDLRRVAGGMADNTIGLAVTRATSRCGVSA